MVGVGLESLVGEVKASTPSLARGMLLSAFRKVFHCSSGHNCQAC